MALLLIIAALGLEPLNEKVVEFARSRLGQKVGDGGCSALASEALRYAGATPRYSERRWGEGDWRRSGRPKPATSSSSRTRFLSEGGCDLMVLL